MSDEKIIVIESRTDVFGTGDEFLCFRIIEGSKYELSVRGYEFLGNVVDFYDDDGEENIPDFIDEKEVIEVLPEYIIGGNLVTYKEDEIIVFHGPHQS